MASHVQPYHHEEEPVTYKSLNQWLNYLMGVTMLTFFLGVLPYAVLYFLGSPEKQLMQKLALAGLVVALKLTGLELHRRAEEKRYSLERAL